MAKAKPERGAKSAAVRDYLRDPADSKLKEIVTALKEQGITVKEREPDDDEANELLK
ncbi:MAG: hypothetical protein ACKV0T_12135 [Planctomycetales bacterium]